MLFAVAPMLDYTDRHARYFLRLISPHIQLYTEMVTSSALIYGKALHLLNFDWAEKYLVLQLGGSNPKDLSECAKIGENLGYDAINLNVGCPSPRVSAGRFGACLMLEPKLVAACIHAMQSAVKIPVSVKCRIGVDDKDAYEDLWTFIDTISRAGCNTFILHARKAWLSGLSPKENREIPPLCYDTVRRVKCDFPQLSIILNGGLKNLKDIEREAHGVDGLMLGRAVYGNPYILAEIEKKFYSASVLNRIEVAEHYIHYIQKRLPEGIKLSAMTRHLLSLFHGEVNGAHFRRFLSGHAKDASVDVIYQALQYVS